MAENNSTALIVKLGELYFATQSTTDKCLISTAIELFSMFLEIALLIIFSHILHMFLKQLGQPSVVSQMLVGILLGPSVIGNANIFNKDKTQITAIANASRIFFMFLVGLEIDITFIRRKIKIAAVICGGNAVPCFIFSIIFGTVVHSKPNVGFIITTGFLIMFNTASPILIRIISELKLTMTEIGRVSVATAIVNDAMCLFMLQLLGFMGVWRNKNDLFLWFGLLIGLILSVVLIRAIVNQVNKKNDYRKEVGDDVLCGLLLIVFLMSVAIETSNFDPMMAAFVMGLLIPRNGPTSRTMVERLTYLVNNFVLPIYFGDAGIGTDLKKLREREVFITVLMVMLLGTISKVGGTMAVAKYLGMQLKEGLVLGLLLNVKGHIDLMIISFGKEKGILGEESHMALLITVLFNGIIAGPIAAYVVHRERQAVQYKYKGLEWLSLNSELRIIACVHSPHDVATMLDLIEISSGNCPPDPHSNLVPYIFNLIELTDNLTSHTVLYHQLQDKQDYINNAGNSQARQVSGMVDKFVRDSNINIHELTAISRIETMHEDLQHGIKDVHAALVIVPFHRRRRFDGKMGIGKEDIRQFNINVLRHAQCSVGILVDRGMDKEANNISVASSSMSSEDKALLRVVVFFLGGPDDREASAYAGRLSLHNYVNVTMVRFLPTFKQGGFGAYASHSQGSTESGSMLMDVEGSTVDQDEDELFISNFFNRFVVTNMIIYEERRLASSTELINELSSMQGMYSLYILGRQIQGPTAHLTTGMTSWEECPDLGPIGDLLVSSDFMLNGTILVIRQHDITTENVS